MNRSIEQALLSLLPTHNSALPEPLTELASSLLAQSRHRASALKAEEEVARPYACAHLACDRLKIALDLPPIEPRPPIPPRIYKRLYSHLDNILPAAAAVSTPTRGTPGRTTGLGSGRVRTPSSKLREQQQEQQQRQLLGTSPLASKTKSRLAPSKEQSLAQFRSPGTATATTTKTAADTTTTTPSKKRPISTISTTTTTTKSNPLPRWMRPTLRYLCTHLGPAQLGPVVAAGMETVVGAAGDGWVGGNLVAVLGALYLYVWRGVAMAGREVERERYARFRREVARVLARAREEVDLGGRGGGGEEGEGEEEKGWEGWHEVGAKDFDAAALRMHRHGFFDLDWVSGIEDLAERERRGREEEGVGEGEGEEEEEDENTEPVRIRRADTMFQERFDYLSERKRKAYAEWKESIMKRIKQLERGDYAR